MAPVTDGDLEHQEDLCRCDHRRPLPTDEDEDSCPQSPSDTVQRILEGVFGCDSSRSLHWLMRIGGRPATSTHTGAGEPVEVYGAVIVRPSEVRYKSIEVP